MSNSNERILTLTTAINPELLNNIYLEEVEKIIDISILTVDYPPVELSIKNNNNFKSTKRAESVIKVYDVAALIIKIKGIKDTSNEIKTKFIMAEEIMFISNNLGDLIIFNGKFDIIPNDLLVEIYKNFSDLKSVNLEKLEDILEISKNQPAIKAYNQLSNYFSIENYSKNNNVFKLLQHQNDVIKLSKKVLLKSLVSWEIRK